MVYEVFVEALYALRANRLRSLLTMLGIIIGVGAVIVMLAVVAGVGAEYRRKIEAHGATVLSVWPKSRSTSAFDYALPPSLTVADVRLIDSLPGIRRAAPFASLSGTAVYASSNASTTVIGTTATYLETRRWATRLGASFSDAESHSARPIALLGQTVARELFGDEIPVGRTITINRRPFRVRGILAPRGHSFQLDEDDCVIVPIRALQQQLASGALREFITGIHAEVRSHAVLDDAQSAIVALLRARHRIRSGEEDDFGVGRATAMTTIVSTLERGQTFMLGSVGLISLLVGGIGIMNVLLVSVAERTREIGLRKALGATRAMISAQFLTEAIVLAVSGGLIGTLIGVSLAGVMSVLAEIETLVTGASVVAALSVSLTVGILFGWYPARRAARLDPVAALREH